MTTPLFLLRCVQLGISIADLDLLTIGLVNDMFTERQNDDFPYKELASQSDFDQFQSKKNRRPCLYCERNKHNRLVIGIKNPTQPCDWVGCLVKRQLALLENPSKYLRCIYSWTSDGLLYK